jgi:hypothetical protein
LYCRTVGRGGSATATPTSKSPNHPQDVGKPGIPRASGARERGFKSRRPDLALWCSRPGCRSRRDACTTSLSRQPLLCGGARVGTGGRLLSVTTQVRFLPPQLVLNRKVKPIGDGSRLESGRAMSLGGSTPSPSASCALGRRWRHWSSPVRGSASGRPPGFEPGDGGSSPPPRACRRPTLCGVV